VSLAFELRTGPSRAASRWVALAHAVGIAGTALAAGLLADREAAAASVALVLAGTWAAGFSWRRRRSRAPVGSLRIDHQGRAVWSPAPVPQRRADQGPPAEPASGGEIEPLRWAVLGDVVWIRCRSDGGTLDLLSGRDLQDDAAWTRLMVWLRWLDRGGATAQRRGERSGAEGLAATERAGGARHRSGVGVR
jgi:hypothetical protein